MHIQAEKSDAPPSPPINPPSVNIKSYTLPAERRTSANGQNLYKVIKSPPHTALARLKIKVLTTYESYIESYSQQNLFSYNLAGICTSHFLFKNSSTWSGAAPPRRQSLGRPGMLVQSEVGRQRRVARRHEQGVRVGRQGPGSHPGLLHVRGCVAVVAEVGVL